MGPHQIVVVGAGPAGIAAAVALKDRGLSPVVLDQADEIAASWRARYDRLRLNTCRYASHLPGRRFPKGTPMFPTRDQLIAHLASHANEDGIALRLSTRVDRIDANGGGWSVATTAGEIHSQQVIVATGHEQLARVPDWIDGSSFAGRVLHASEYRNPEPFRGQSVLVVGPGCSGMEIAYDLAAGGAGKVRLAVRTPPNIVLREGPGGFPGDLIAVSLLRLPVRVADAIERFGRRMDLGDLTEFGLPAPEEGLFARYRREGTVPSIVDKEVIEAIKAGTIEVVGHVTGLDREGARLGDGRRLQPEVVILATGYRRRLASLVGHLGVLDERQLPRAQGAPPAAPGLRFIGFTTRPGVLGYMGKQARAAAKAIARELSSAPPGRATRPGLQRGRRHQAPSAEPGPRA